MSRVIFSAIRSEGGLLPGDLLTRIAAGERRLPGTDASSYGLLPHESVGEAVNRAWFRLTAAWKAFRQAASNLPERDRGTTLTRERWLLPLFEELGYGRLLPARSIEADGRSFAISHRWNHSPVHLVSFRLELDKRVPGVTGAAASSPHGLLQDVLNRSDDHLWGIASNGRCLRVLRDHHSLTTRAYLEFDLEQIFDAHESHDLYSEFRLLWLVCHSSRVRAETPEGCILEQWFNAVKEEGVQALDRLREGMQQSMDAFGTGFLRHPANRRLRDELDAGRLTAQDYYRQLLRLNYRLIFLFVIEDRKLLLESDASAGQQKRFAYYATRGLRQLADQKRGSAHPDLWRRLSTLLGLMYEGYAPLGLPAYGSFLWSPEATPALNDLELSNEALLTALRALNTLHQDGVRRPVAWHLLNVDELGSIYESLMELHPAIHKESDRDTFRLETAPGHDRKTTGSYYTPSSLVQSLLDSALDPVLDDAERKPDPEASILGLKVVDPACGSGHFLVAAARRMADRLARIRTGDAEPSPRDYEQAIRDVVGRCIYGVDLNEMAVELCKVALWILSIEPGKPLTFLDAHIQHGNALLGTTPRLLADGIPNDAWKPLTGDDSAVARELRKRNSKERDQVLGLFDRYNRDENRVLRQIGDEAMVVETAGDGDLRLVRAKEGAWRRFQASPAVKDEIFLADLWCSAFVWRKDEAHAEMAPTQEWFRRIGVDAAICPPEVRKEVKRLARAYRFFHWHLAFPGVFAEERGPIDEATGWAGGFDAIVGNPPWETLSPNVKEFFSKYDQEIRFQDPAGQKTLMNSLLEDESISDAWSNHCRSIYGQSHFVKTSGRYSMFAPGSLGSGDLNLFRMFIEVAVQVALSGGRLSQIVPEGIYNGANCTAIRKELFNSNVTHRIIGFENHRKLWFDNVDSRTKFAIYSATRGGNTESVEVRFLVRDVQTLELALRGDTLEMSLKMIRDFAPETYALMEFGEQIEIDITRKCYGLHPQFGDSSISSPFRHYRREVSMGSDRQLFLESADGMPVYEGRMVTQYDHRAKAYRSGRARKAVWEDLPFDRSDKEIAPQWRIEPSALPARLAKSVVKYRVGFCDVASPTNERTLVAALIPPGCVCGDKVPTITFGKGCEYYLLAWIAIANSFTVDFLVRKKVSLKMSANIMDTLPFPRYQSSDEHLSFLVPRAAALCCTGDEMIPFWDSLAKQGWVTTREQRGDPVGVVDDEARFVLRCEIDAFVALNVYQLNRHEISFVLDSFPIVRKHDTRRFGRFRTKEEVLSCYDKMTHALAVGVPIHTALVPQPAEPEVQV